MRLVLTSPIPRTFPFDARNIGANIVSYLILVLEGEYRARQYRLEVYFAGVRIVFTETVAKQLIAHVKSDFRDLDRPFS